MAALEHSRKTWRKSIKKIVDKKVKNKKVEQNKNHNLKHFSVNITRMSEKEAQTYSNSVVIDKIFSVKIANNTLEINNTKQKRDNGTFNIAFRKRLSDLVLQHCESTI